MRASLLLPVLLSLAACSGGPQALGITGPEGTAQSPPAQMDPLDNPATLDSGTRYGPSIGPSTGGGRYWGYN